MRGVPFIFSTMSRAFLESGVKGYSSSRRGVAIDLVVFEVVSEVSRVIQNSLFLQCFLQLAGGQRETRDSFLQHCSTGHL